MGHILVVDDEPAIVTVVREGFMVRAVASGEEALTRNVCWYTRFPRLRQAQDKLVVLQKTGGTI